MAVVDIRRRTGYLFLAVIVGHVILISTQVTTKRGVPMLEAAVFGIFSEVQRGANTVATSVRSGWQDYFALRQVRSENEQLKQQLGELRVRLQEERGLAQQSQSLQKLLDLEDQHNAVDDGRERHRRRREPGVPHDHDRQGNRRRPPCRHGGHWRRRESLAGSFSPARGPRKSSS